MGAGLLKWFKSHQFDSGTEQERNERAVFDFLAQANDIEVLGGSIHPLAGLFGNASPEHERISEATEVHEFGHVHGICFVSACRGLGRLEESGGELLEQGLVTGNKGVSVIRGQTGIIFLESRSEFNEVFVGIGGEVQEIRSG